MERDYLTSLREIHKVCGHNKQLIKKEDVVLIHNGQAKAELETGSH